MTITLGLLARIAGAVVLAVVLALVASGRLQFDQFTPLVPIPLLPPARVRSRRIRRIASRHRGPPTARERRYRTRQTGYPGRYGPNGIVPFGLSRVDT